jgi:hypothetical protein
MTTINTAETRLFEALNGIPDVNIQTNLRRALAAGRRSTSLLAEVIALRRGVGRVSPQEYFYYRLWDPHLSMAEKRRFVGKQAQHRMHVTANDRHWFQTAADKILFHTIMAGARLPVPELLAATQRGRVLPGIPILTNQDAAAALLRRDSLYPLFAKPVAGKYSLSVLSADSYDRDNDAVILLDGIQRATGDVVASLVGGSGYLIQRRLAPDHRLATLFGPRLWSVRVLALVRRAGPAIHRAVAKITTGMNAADNFWRPGNMLGAIELDTGIIHRVVRGTGADLAVNEPHPDTGRPIVGTAIPDWSRLVELVLAAAPVFAGIRTQSWDIALTDQGPVFLEVNFGGDLNLVQLANGKGILDDAFVAHLRECGYRI